MEGCVDRIIPDSSVSRLHCRIVKDQNGIALIDLGSTNGSFVNGLKIAAQKKTYIDEGDEVKLGRICFDLR
jgi:pSer/pThr/pTyr-binding forkhead associated (FHA) protein